MPAHESDFQHGPFQEDQAAMPHQRPTMDITITDYEAVTVLIALRTLANQPFFDDDEGAQDHINSIVDEIKFCASRIGLSNVR